MTYAVVATDPAGTDRRLSAEVDVPSVAMGPVASVESVRPAAAVLPLNHLRFYVYFSHPMSRGQAASAIQLRNAESGEPLLDALLPGGPELWDKRRQRLTVLLDPGRIKRGLVPYTERGYPLTEGQAIIFEVDARFCDDQGRPLQASFSQRYEIGPALRSRIDPRHWRIATPRASSSEPLLIEFARPIDYALATRCIWIEDAAGTVVPGQPTLDSHDSVWRFVPAGAWSVGQYVVAVDPRLEDVAGNSVLRPFDRERGQRTDDPLESTMQRFEVRLST